MKLSNQKTYMNIKPSSTPRSFAHTEWSICVPLNQIRNKLAPLSVNCLSFTNWKTSSYPMKYSDARHEIAQIIFAQNIRKFMITHELIVSLWWYIMFQTIKLVSLNIKWTSWRRAEKDVKINCAKIVHRSETFFSENISNRRSKTIKKMHFF